MRGLTDCIFFFILSTKGRGEHVNVNAIVFENEMSNAVFIFMFELFELYCIKIIAIKMKLE